jgi:hypothetical protein
MAINPLNDISKIYLEQVVESSHLETDMKKRQSENEKAREDMKKTAAYKSMAATAAKKMEEGLDPVGEEDDDIDNDRRKNTKSDKYLLRRRRAVGKAISTQEAKEVKKWWDDDGDGIGYEAGEVSSKFKKNKKKLKEGLSNWRQDLSEVMDDVVANKEVKEKKVNNKIKTSAMGGGIKLGESIENLGGELVEMVEIDGVLDEITDIELTLLSDDLIEEVVEEFFYECLEEGYEVDEIEDMLIESIETSAAILNESADDMKIEKRNDKLEKVKSAVKKVARGVGYAAGAVVRGAKAIGREVKAGYAAGKESDSGSSSGTRKPQTYRNTPQQEKRPGLLSRLGSKLKSGLKKAVASGARAVSRGARDVARNMDGGGSSSTPKSTPAPVAKKPTEKPADPWEGSSTTPPKAKAKPAAKPKAKKKTGKLDSLLADIRKEEVELDERALDSTETMEKERIFKAIKPSKLAKSYPEKSPKEIKSLRYAISTKSAKRNMDTSVSDRRYGVEEAMMPDSEVEDQNKNNVTSIADKQKLANLKAMEQKQRQLRLQRFNLQKQGKLPLDTN